MTTPAHEKAQLSFPAFPADQPDNPIQDQPLHQRSSDEDGTLQGEVPDHGEHGYLRVETDVGGAEHHPDVHFRSPLSPSQHREQASRLDDDLLLLQAEQMVSRVESQREALRESRSITRTRSRTAQEPVDDFDVSTNPIHQITKVYQPPARPATRLAKFFKKVHESSFLVRYFLYITPVMLLLLIPTLLGLFVFKKSTVGDVELFWFGIWLEIIWLTLWLSRIIARMIPYPMGMVSSLFTNNAKKWRDLGKQLEVPATIFFWLLAIEISFLPTMKNHHLSGNSATHTWEIITNKVIIAIFVAAVLNFIEKIIIQLIAISFHLRTYADRIELNKFQIASLVKLYMYSKEKIAMTDEEFEHPPDTGPSSGNRTPKIYVEKVQRNARHALNRVGDVAGKVAGDFTGRAVASSTHPHQVVLSLLNSTNGSQVLARRLYRTYAQEGSENVFSDDLRHAFDNDNEADAAFTMFDKDMNGDISMEELEAVCVEIGRERKAITASLKDLDSVVSKLDNVFVFIVILITILVFVSLISTSASTALTSLGSTVLALSWLFAATAQEFLQSLIFVFVKHPFDVGDRVTIYGNTGKELKGDDYFVKEISLLFTEFKKMEGHVVQAPNSYLNTLFILNQRRSGGLAEAVPVTVKFGTTLDQIDGLRRRLLEFVGSENREYQKNILTELTTITEAYSVTLNVVFFYKSNWQNELLRLQRRNKFICAMMVSMQEMGIEGPRLGAVPGATQDYPMFVHNNHPPPYVAAPGSDYKSPDAGHGQVSFSRDEPIVVPPGGQPTANRHPSILRHRGLSMSRQRGESISQMGKRVDFSLGMQNISSGADMGDIYDKPKPRLPSVIATSPSPGGRASKDTTRPSEEGGSMGQSVSRESQLGKVTSSNSLRIHKNRFFGRGKSKADIADDGTDLDDLEAGTRDVGLANIPEASAFNSPDNDNNPNKKQEVHRQDTDRAGGNRIVRITDPGTTLDPRTGLVSSQAVQGNGDGETELPLGAGANVARD